MAFWKGHRSGDGKMAGTAVYECSICLSNAQLGPHLRQRLARRDFSGKIFEVESLWYADQLVGKMTQKVSEIRNVREETNLKQNNTECFVDGINLR